MHAGVVIAAILWLAPQVGPVQAQVYGEAIHREAERWDIDPLLVVAVIHRESRWNPRARSKTHDWGLLQIHVSRTTHSGYLARPERLFNPKLNIRLGIRLMAFWRDYHAGRCRGDHPWWAHYKYGRRIPRKRKGKKVDVLYQQLLAWANQSGV